MGCDCITTITGGFDNPLNAENVCNRRLRMASARTLWFSPRDQVNAARVHLQNRGVCYRFILDMRKLGVQAS